jgi:cell division protein FtsW
MRDLIEPKNFYDPLLVFAGLVLLGFGTVMVTSASLSFAEGLKLPAWHFAIRHGLYLLIGLIVGWGATYVPIRFWRNISIPLLFIGILFLALLLIPGLSREINGSVRWLFIGPISIQVSEFVKLTTIIYLASYIARRRRELQETAGFIRPLIIVGLIAVLLLLEPDFGATVVILATAMGMLFLAGVPLHRFLVLLLLAVGGLIAISLTSPYRLARLTAFLDPWSDQYNTGYQLTQSLIAFGRGGFLGAGLGNSVQKLLYLPEPHNDFLYAVISEELGLLGAMSVLSLLGIIVWRAFGIGRRTLKAGNRFAGYLAYGIALWLGIQTIINVGVNVGVLPTKGLTLPLMSYGGNSLIVSIVALALLLRIDFEQRLGKQEN